MIVINRRYAAVEVYPLIEEVEINAHGVLFGFWRQRTQSVLICRMPDPDWIVLGRAKTLTLPQYQPLHNSLHELDIYDFNPLILYRIKRK